jgi:large subunit ribosomal protein L7A
VDLEAESDIHRTVVIGKKQAKRHILKNKVKKIYVARDAEAHVIAEIIQMCIERNIDIEYVDHKKELGKIFNIDVNAAIAAVIK